MLVSTVWIVVGLALVGIAIALISSWQRSSDRDLGAVSTHWIAEHRADQGQHRS
jgi:hypothetical protein